MARIAGVNLPSGKHVWVSLTRIYGVGKSHAYALLGAVKINPHINIDTLSETELDKIRSYIKENGVLLEGDLRREVTQNIKRLQEIGCYRGIRHSKRLPVRGQNTRTNARTRKGRAVTIANKKK